jgi:hypothetical protein
MKLYLVSALVFATGCSWIGMTSPPTIDCQEHPALPIVDGAAAVAFAGFGAGVIAGTPDADYHLPAIAFVAVPALVVSTLYLASTLHGVRVNRACRAAKT